MRIFGLVIILFFFSLINSCSDREKIPNEFPTSSLYITEANWEFNNDNIQTFKRFWITFQNLSQKDIRYIKFRLTIKVKDGLDREVFRRTIEKNEKVFSNDIVRYEIEELRDFYIGVNVSVKGNFVWDAEVLEVKE